jgi:predicted RNA-binding Zn-ribbon protein involved in translation (DUF1610 family)
MINEKPSIAEIRGRTEALFKRYFGRKLRSDFRVRISRRMRTAAAKAGPHSLTVSEYYHNRHGWGEQLERTLKHEIIHIAGILNHGPQFKAELRRINAERYCKSYSDTQSASVYKCNECGFVFTAQSFSNECPKCGDLIYKIGEVEV